MRRGHRRTKAVCPKCGSPRMKRGKAYVGRTSRDRDKAKVKLAVRYWCYNCGSQTHKPKRKAV